VFTAAKLDEQHRDPRVIESNGAIMVVWFIEIAGDDADGDRERRDVPGLFIVAS
jgi:hypothetical protein